jgi:hypothetical protein
MKRGILVLVILSILLFWTGISASELRTKESLEKKLNEIYSEVFCVGCERRKTIDHNEDCPIARELRTKVRLLVEKGFDKETIVWNFNGRNIAFIYQLPAEVIRNVNCPCACDEKVWVCLGGENDCPVIEILTKDIKKLKDQGVTGSEIIKTLENSPYQEKYNAIIASAIKNTSAMESYDVSNIPDFILDNAICSCECTETLRTCIEKMPWCKRIGSMISEAALYLYVMKLSPEDVVSGMYAPCAKICAKKTEGEYLGENCFLCQRPILDKAYYKEVNGKEEVFCCESCPAMITPLPQAILDNVECKVCPCDKTLGECNEGHCPFLSAEKKLIKIWLLEGMTEDEVIRKLK